MQQRLRSFRIGTGSGGAGGTGSSAFPIRGRKMFSGRPCAAATTASGAPKWMGNLCGYAAVSRTGDAVNLDDIAVSPAFRRQGIGRQLLDWAHGQFPESEFWLEVRESNAAAIALYESAGYRQVGFRKRYYHAPEEGAVLMTREVKNMTELLMQLKAFLLWALFLVPPFVLTALNLWNLFARVQRQEKAGSQSVCRTFHGNWWAEYFLLLCGV
ncbi:GNAT family N-acetyltransferase [Ruminococcus sp.]|uniref:GNAT family N-acetyltransferase n=1 Tax=Ruminococcus sp. TaxID=41978 RepID=UPI0039931DE4